MLQLSNQVRITPHTLISEVDGESVILNLKSEEYFGLDEVGTAMWQALVDSSNLEEAFLKLLQRYEVDEATLREDFEELTQKLIENGLLEISEK